METSDSTNQLTPDDLKLLTTALNHAWSWFEVHAVQRQNFVNFFLIAVAFLSAAYVGALTGKANYLAAADCLVGVVISLAFLLIDLRNRELIRASELPLMELQDRLAEAVGVDSLRILRTIDQPQYRVTSIGRVLRVLHSTTLIGFIAAGIYALVR
jgi:hypothetical protein